ncbi:MAG: HTH domain-containing protein [Candidatus Aenigmarchaeota archaeon]|nr:HTH domain-containing protein [Candidatus Aenigmarchaeota archaeon]
MSLPAKIRREKVKALLIRGVSIENISKTLDVHRNTINNDIKRIKEEINKEIKKESLDAVLFHFVASYDEIGKELWKTYISSKNENVKLGALNSLMKLTKEKIEILQRLGILESHVLPDQSINIQVTIVEPEKENNREIIDMEVE